MKKKYLSLTIVFLIFSCGIFPRKTSGNLILVEKIGISDTITVNVSGRIIDRYDKFSLKNAKIKLINNENYYEQTCDSNGEFEFKCIASGKYIVRGGYSGYYRLNDTIKFESGDIIELKIGLGYDE